MIYIVWILLVPVGIVYTYRTYPPHLPGQWLDKLRIHKDQFFRFPLNMNMFIKITVSIGVEAAPENAEDSLALIRHADRALYVGAKRAGRNRVAEYVN